MPENKKKPFPKSRVYVSFGLLVALFGVLFLLSPATRLWGLSYYTILFPFGSIGLYLFSLFLMEAGLHLMFHKWWKPYPTRMVIGFLLLNLGTWAFVTEVASGGLNGDSAANFPQALEAASKNHGFALYGPGPISGGYLGSLIFGGFDGAGLNALSYVISITLFLLGLLLSFWPLWKRVFRSAKAGIAVAKARRDAEKQKREAEEEGSFVIESEEPIDPIDSPRPEPIPLSKATPELSFSSQPDEEPLPVAPSSPLSSYVFAPAGGSTLPTRKSLRTENASARAQDVEGDPTPVLSPMAPREVTSPTPQSYSQNPVQKVGLKEAFFVPKSDLEPSSPKTASPTFEAEPEPEPQPEPTPDLRSTIIMAQPLAKEAAPAIVQEPPIVEASPVDRYRPEIEEEPVEKRALEPVLDTQSIIHEPKPAESITLLDEEPSEEEEEYVPPSNDPIVLAPNPSGILTPSTMNQEPEEAPEEAEETDDDVEAPLPSYVFPDASLLDEGKGNQDLEAITAECAEKAALIDKIFADFGVGAHVTEYLVGPSITRYSIEADPGVSVSTISRYIQDLEVRLGGVPVRFVERVLGLACSALEVANTTRRIVPFKEVFLGLPPRKQTADLHIPFGIDIAGKLKEADLGKFPHMLVAGTSGSGKSIFAHGVLMSLVMRNRPENLKLVLIDPKRGVEMAPYKDMPHLLCPIVKEARPAKNALKKLCEVMDRRYELFAKTEVRDIAGYNQEYALPNGKKRMPYIVVFVDEFADLVGECKEISEYVLRIAQKARACGIHLIVATQRPDVKVITGTIKSNLLCRVALTVASSTDSQTILGVGGAEDLYGYGDMLIDCQELSKRDFVRAQGCLATSHEMKAVCDFVRAQMKPSYDPEFLNLEDDDDDSSSGPEIRDGGYAPVAPTMSSQELRKISDEEKYQYVKSVIMTREYCSISMIQREFEVGFPRAGKILARLQADGIVASPGDTPNNSRGCRVLVHEDPTSGGGIA